jgi:hypothetical protein
MIRFAAFATSLLLFTACAQDNTLSSVQSERIPPSGSVNEFGLITVQAANNGYTVSVVPFSRRAIYRVVISESSESTAVCRQFETDSTQMLQVEKRDLEPDFLHFVRVCVYFDEGDSGASNLVLANDRLFVGLSKETLGLYTGELKPSL